MRQISVRHQETIFNNVLVDFGPAVRQLSSTFFCALKNMIMKYGDLSDLYLNWRKWLIYIF